MTVRNFVGLNSNVGAYDDGIVDELAKAAKWVREYHSWAHFEPEEDIYTWDDQTQSIMGNWPFHTRYVEACRDAGVNLLICTQNSTEWASLNGEVHGPPHDEGCGNAEDDYYHKVEFISQLVARYGSVKAHPSQLQTHDQLTGLNYVQYYEDENEPDQWWWQPVWPGFQYGIYLNAVHDGTHVSYINDAPLTGIKRVDPAAVHVLGGLVGANTDYLDAIVQSAGRVPFDILNFHHYCTNHSAAEGGKSPEHEIYGLKPDCDQMKAWRDAHAPGMPIWCTEFGWDTYQNASGSHSYVYAPELSQANYLLRSLFLFMGYGIEKAFVFFDKDPNSKNTQQYSSSGILSDRAGGLAAKPAFFFLATLQNRLGHFVFDGVDKYREGQPEIYSYKFSNPEDETEFAFAIWCREAGSDKDNGSTVANYQYDLPGVETAELIRPVDHSETGDVVAVELLNAGSDGSTVILPQISETPQFLLVKSQLLSSVTPDIRRPDTFHLNAYPNPFNPVLNIRYHLEAQTKVELALYNVLGRKIRTLVQAYQSSGIYQIQADLSDAGLTSGVYVIQLTTDAGRVKQKVTCVQ